MAYTALPASQLKAGSITDDLFNAVDRNHDGVITRSEFRTALKGNVIGVSSGGASAAQAPVTAYPAVPAPAPSEPIAERALPAPAPAPAMERATVIRTGRASSPENAGSATDRATVFSMLDRNGDGVISRAEWNQAMGTTYGAPPREALHLYRDPSEAPYPVRQRSHSPPQFTEAPNVMFPGVVRGNLVGRYPANVGRQIVVLGGSLGVPLAPPSPGVAAPGFLTGGTVVGPPVPALAPLPPASVAHYVGPSLASQAAAALLPSTAPQVMPMPPMPIMPSTTAVSRSSESVSYSTALARPAPLLGAPALGSTLSSTVTSSRMSSPGIAVAPTLSQPIVPLARPLAPYSPPPVVKVAGASRSESPIREAEPVAIRSDAEVRSLAETLKQREAQIQELESELRRSSAQVAERDAQIAWLARQNAEQRRQNAELQHQKVMERASQQSVRPAGLAQNATALIRPQDSSPAVVVPSGSGPLQEARPTSPVGADRLSPVGADRVSPLGAGRLGNQFGMDGRPSAVDSLGPGTASSTFAPRPAVPDTMQQVDPTMTAPARLNNSGPGYGRADQGMGYGRVEQDDGLPAMQRARPQGGGRPTSARPPGSARGRGRSRGRGAGSLPPERPAPPLPQAPQPPPAPAPAEDQLSAPHSLDGIDMDEIDQKVHQWLTDHPDFVVEVEKLRKGWYFFKEPINKKVYIKTIGRDGKVVVRVGGGYKQLEEFFQHYHGHYA